MATQVRRDASRFGKPNSQGDKNRAITSLVAEAVHDQRVRSTTKQAKKAGFALEQSGHRAQAVADRAQKFGRGLTRENTALQRRATSLQELQGRYERIAKRKDTSAAFHAKYPGITNKPKKEQTKRWNNYLQSLPEYISMHQTRLQYDAALKRLNQGKIRQNALNDRITAANKRTMLLQKRYMKAARRARQTAQVVRYTP